MMGAQDVVRTQADGINAGCSGQMIEQAREAIRALEALLICSQLPTDAAEIEALEAQIVRETDRIAGLIIALHVQGAIESPQTAKQIAEIVRAHPKRFKSDGRRDVQIHPARGEPVVISACYYRRTGTSNRMRRKGMYPALILLGIQERRTPAAGSEIALLAAAMASLKEAAHMLEQQGRPVDVKTIRLISYRYAQRARAAIEAHSSAFPESADGRRIGVSVDGGRLRVRTDKSGRHTPKGRKRYHTKWREPKLLHIWALDPQGHIDRSVLPLIDGTLQGPDHIFMLLRYYLRQFEVQSAAAVLFIADGARWIWNRFQSLIAEFSLDPRKVFQFLDFYHAVEHLGALASLRTGWSAAYRKQWVCKQRRLLKQGCIDQLIAAIESACSGRKGKKLNKEKRYFIRNRNRLKFNIARRRRLPMGSGPMESAIRRVVNLRLKGAGIFWHENNADAMLLLRSFYKAGRWKTLVTLANSAPIEAFA
jgi:hypothetical protein